MRRQHPVHKSDIPVSIEIWQQLLGASIDTGYEKEDWEIAAEAINEWMRRHKPDTIPMAPTNGHQWKSVFLPDGTLLRTVFGGKNYHCMVEGDRILYDGQAVSPSGFVNAVGGIRRNAWRCTWILFPDSKDWKLADTLRTRERARRERKPARVVQQNLATPPDAARVPANVAPEGTAASASQSHVQYASHDRAPRTEWHADEGNRRQRAGIPLWPPGFQCATDRRNKADGQLMTLLRQELLPLLYRISSFDGAAQA
ncbi:MAG: hypothetical protein V4631_22850 [Pseudomonadota bacterium]